MAIDSERGKTRRDFMECMASAMSTAYPQPAPGTAPGPGPLEVPAEQLRSYLGLREVTWNGKPGPLAIVDTKLG